MQEEKYETFNHYYRRFVNGYGVKAIIVGALLLLL